MRPIRPCPCGSGETAREAYDARGIYLCKVCDACEKRKLAGYRPAVLNDPNYPADEPIDEEGPG